jgi:predicted nucleotidyltransferase
VQPKTTEHVARFSDWVHRQPNLRRLWLFGSRARGTERPDSDIDLAFEIDILLDEAKKFSFREETLPRWIAELQSLSEFPVQLEPWASDGTNVAGYVASCNVLIYERAA